MAENITRQNSAAGKLLDKIFGKMVISEEQKDENKLQPSTISDSDQPQDFYIVKVVKVVKVISTSESDTNSNGESPLDEQVEDGDEKIPKEDAVCKLCFIILSAGETIMQTNCSCKKAYIHEKCSDIWSIDKGNKKCDVCENEVKDIQVKLVEPHGGGDATKVQKRHRSLLSTMFKRES